MADNVTANPGSGGAVFATEDLGGIQLPVSKPSFGAHGVSTPIARSAGNGMPVQGEVTHGSSVATAPVLLGAEARTADGTPVTSGQVSRIQADSLGKVTVLQGSTHDMQANGTTNYTTNTGADVIAAAGVGVRIAVTSVLVTNAHATVSTKVSIRDGTTVKIVGYAPALGGGFSLNAGGRPLFITTANAAANAICTTTGADVDVSISGYKIAN